MAKKLPSILLGPLALLVFALALGGSVARGALAPSDGEGAARYEVLFVGNSYTRLHAMPLTVRSLLRSLPSRPVVRVERLTHPGWTLERHLASGQAQRRIGSGGFTHVVIQGHSLAAIEDATGLGASVRELVGASRRVGARAVLYETWARRAGVRDYERLAPTRTPAQMFARIRASYEALSRELASPVAPVGRAFELGVGAHPDLALYGDDGSHPSELGSYLAAVTLASVIAGVDARSFSYAPHRVGRARARLLRELAARAIERGP